MTTLVILAFGACCGLVSYRWGWRRGRRRAMEDVMREVIATLDEDDDFEETSPDLKVNGVTWFVHPPWAGN